MSEPAAPRDLRNHYGELLRRAQAGEEIEIVRDGVVVALLAPPRPPAATSLERLRQIFGGSVPIDRDRFFDDLDTEVDAALEDVWDRR
jgi:antitoxin (DNA-binding transcriptional repressor) of toxin-antitoxin stability system